jgi:hypothetical protein
MIELLSCLSDEKPEKQEEADNSNTLPILRHVMFA